MKLREWSSRSFLIDDWGSLVVFIMALALFAGLIVALPSSAAAEGYNDGGYNYTDTTTSPVYGRNAGIYVRTPETAKQYRSPGGPHGGYTTTTNKCQDCHATHYALGSYMLLRANKREEACDFCHAGGGGSSINVQMDNHYGSSSAVLTETMGVGTGHTLGFKGLSAADINPAYSSPDGFACFDCHSPHGNSQRVLTTFHNPGRRMGGVITHTGLNQVLVTRIFDVDGLVLEDPTGQTDLVAYSIANPATVFYGEETYEGNFVVADNGTVHPEPIWPTGRFLLLKNPDREPFEDTVLGDQPGIGADEGKNKWAIDWESPLGLGFHVEELDGDPADSDPTDDALRFLTMSEFCMDCHDGAVGASTHVSRSWVPRESDTTTGSYQNIYHHDSNPRLRDDQMYLWPGGTHDNPDGNLNNYGNHCRKCHIGGSSCRQCHGITPDGTVMPAYDRLLSPYDPPSAHDDYLTTYWAQSYVKRSAIPSVTVAGIGLQCVDGGFSWPHRTLGINLLKDEMYGVDFDGKPIAPGAYRMTSAQVDAYLGLQTGGYLDGSKMASEFATDWWRASPDSTHDIFGSPAENLDSMCLDCHGDATYWNGDDPSYFTPGLGWEILLKGLN
jgi:hypothetical protein